MLGLMRAGALARLAELKDKRQSLLSKLREEKVYPTAEMQRKLSAIPTPVLGKSITFEELLRRPEIDCSHLEGLGFAVELDPNVCEPVEIEVKYSGYVKRQVELIAQSKRMEDLKLPEQLSYGDIRGLSNEEVEKLSRIQPRTLGQVQRISGVNPSAVQAIMVYLKGRGRLKDDVWKEDS
jgi:tRNA uridine 5-carboxymethylaminomethyl modification enzyme